MINAVVLVFDAITGRACIRSLKSTFYNGRCVLPPAVHPRWWQFWYVLLLKHRLTFMWSLELSDGLVVLKTNIAAWVRCFCFILLFIKSILTSSSFSSSSSSSSSFFYFFFFTLNLFLPTHLPNVIDCLKKSLRWNQNIYSLRKKNDTVCN